MAQKFMSLISGVKTMIEAITSSAGAGDAGKIIGLDGTGKLPVSMLPTGVGAETKIVPASEDLADGDFVNIWYDTDTVKARKADASSPGKQADGFVMASVTSGQNATVYLEGTNSHVTGYTGGDSIYLSATPGQGTVTAPSTTGYICQQIGISLSSTEITFSPQEPTTLA